MTMRRLPDIAIRECVGELRAACRLPIDQTALDVLIERLRPNFERILGHPDGARRWADHGQRMRNNGRHLGALADFYSTILTGMSQQARDGASRKSLLATVAQAMSLFPKALRKRGVKERSTATA